MSNQAPKPEQAKADPKREGKPVDVGHPDTYRIDFNKKPVAK